jgi:hypothetical protein
MAVIGTSASQRRCGEQRLPIGKEFDVRFGGAPDIERAAAGERHDVAGAAGGGGLLAKAGVGLTGD